MQHALHSFTNSVLNQIIKIAPVESPTNADNLSQEEHRREGEKPFCSQSAESIPKTTQSKRVKTSVAERFIQKENYVYEKNKLSMLQILRFLINILKTPSPGKCRDLLGHSGDCREQRRNALKHILRFTFHSIPFRTHPKNFNNVVTRTNWKVITRQTAYISRVEAIAHHRTRLHRE